MLTCWLLCACHTLWAAETSRQAYVITLQHRLPETLIPSVQSLLAEGDTMTGFGNELIITTSADRINPIRQIVQQMDTPMRNLLVSVRNNSSGAQQDRQQGFSGSIKREHIRIDTGEPVQPHEGLTVSSEGLGYSTSHSQRSFSTSTEQQIRAVEGMPAFIYTGELRLLPMHDPYGHPDTVEVEALQGVYVTAQLTGEQVVLTISTSNDRFDDSSGLRQPVIDSEQLSTTVSGRIGEWIDLGGLTLAGTHSGASQVKKTTTRSISIGNIAVKITALD